MDQKFTVEKLNDTNYQIWKFRLEMLLTKDDLWHVVEKGKPDKINNDWEKKNRHAMAVISLSVDDNHLMQIKNDKTAHDMWNSLSNIYERKTLTSKLYVLRKLYKIRYTEHQSMREHINQMMTLVDQLRGIGEELSDSHKAALLLCSLPESYSSLVTAIEARPESEVSLILVKNKLIDEYKRRKELAIDTSENRTSFNSYSALNRNRRYSLNSDHSRDITCFNCGKQGHFKRDCKSKGKYNRNEGVHSSKSTVEVDETNVLCLFLRFLIR